MQPNSQSRKKNHCFQEEMEEQAQELRAKMEGTKQIKKNLRFKWIRKYGDGCVKVKRSKKILKNKN